MLILLVCVKGRKSLSTMYIDYTGRWKTSQSEPVGGRLASSMLRQKIKLKNKLKGKIRKNKISARPGLRFPRPYHADGGPRHDL